MHAPPEAVWGAVEGIGGKTGWYSMRAAWKARGMIDRRPAGRPAARAARSAPAAGRRRDGLLAGRGDHPRTLLRLRAEMKLPGLAWLELTVEPERDGETTYRQRAIFYPHGLAGHAYWRSIEPFHGIVFGAMLRNITEAAEQADQPSPTALSGAG